MALQLYSASCVDVIFGEKELGFVVGKSTDNFPIVISFLRHKDNSLYPLEVVQSDLLFL